MKKLLLILLGMMATISMLAQAPDAFQYQAVARNNQGEPIRNQEVEFQIDILQGSANGQLIYSETHIDSTNAFGLVNLVIGKGHSKDDLSSIDWSNGPYFIEIRFNGNLMGTSQLLSVPYAKYADETGNTFSGNFDDLTGIPENLDKDASDDFSGNYIDLTNKPSLEKYIDSTQSTNWDKDTTNELQTLSISADTIYLTSVSKKTFS